MFKFIKSKHSSSRVTRHASRYKVLKNKLVFSTALLINLILCSHFSFGQGVYEIKSDDLPGFTITRNECFDGSSLWGYMNGGADIYLEYGFEILRVEEFTKDNESIKLELYKMSDPLCAFGIYSFKTFKCKQAGVITSLDCLNRFQFQLIYGDYYVQLISESGSEKAKQFMIDIANILLSKLEYKELKLSCNYLTDSLDFSLSEIKMLKGELGIQDKAMDLVDCFIDIEKFQVYNVKKTVEGEKVKYYEIIFDEPEMKYKFLESNEEKDLFIVNEGDISIVIRK